MKTTPGSACAIALAIALTGCAANDGNSPNDCAVSLSFDPANPIAGPTSEVRVTSVVSAPPDVRTFYWSVRNNGSTVDFEDALPDESAITFLALNTGVYEVTLDVSIPSASCNQARQTVTVRDMSATTLDVRLHVTPPLGIDAPPIDKPLLLEGGGDHDLGAVVFEPGLVISGTVRDNGGNDLAGAYMRFVPAGAPEAVVETYVGTTGTYSARIANQSTEVLIIPSSTVIAPRRFTWTSGALAPYVLDAGTPVSGVVRGPGGTPLGGARVQFSVGGVPSTVATTAGNGTFTARASELVGDVTVMVTPPAGSGLPRLESTSTGFDLNQSVTIAYNNITLRDLSGTQVTRNAAALANAKVTVVGTLAAIGTVTAGPSANATGTLRIAASANGSGILPGTLVPAASLDAVIEAGPGDYAVAAFNTTAAVPGTIIAPVMTMFATTVSYDGDMLGGARLELLPTGALALAGVPTPSFIANAAGVVNGVAAAGGEYDVWWSDPGNRAGVIAVPGVSAGAVASTPSIVLPKPLLIFGTLTLQGDPNKISGAAVELRCQQCIGIERDRPLAEVASDSQGAFELAVADPAAM